MNTSLFGESGTPSQVRSDISQIANRLDRAVRNGWAQGDDIYIGMGLGQGVCSRGQKNTRANIINALVNQSIFEEFSQDRVPVVNRIEDDSESTFRYLPAGSRKGYVLHPKALNKSKSISVYKTDRQLKGSPEERFHSHETLFDESREMICLNVVWEYRAGVLIVSIARIEQAGQSWSWHQELSTLASPDCSTQPAEDEDELLLRPSEEALSQVHTKSREQLG